MKRLLLILIALTATTGAVLYTLKNAPAHPPLTTNPATAPAITPPPTPPPPTTPTTTTTTTHTTRHTSAVAPPPLAPWNPQDFSYGYWLNGWRKHPSNTTPDILAIETGHFGFTLNIDNIPNAAFAPLTDHSTYTAALAQNAQRLAHLPKAQLLLEARIDGQTYRATHCRIEAAPQAPHSNTARLWESGKLVQHYDVQDLIFQNDQGNELPCNATLDLVAWPAALTLNATLTPDAHYTNGPCVGISGNGWCIINKPLILPHRPELDPEHFTAELWTKIPRALASEDSQWLLCKNKNDSQDGNYGFRFGHKTIEALLNIGGGKNNRHILSVRQHPPLTYDTWHHLALTYDGKTMTFFINGRARGSQEINKPRRPGSSPLVLGQRADLQGTPTKALFDQLCIWNRALSPNEIKKRAQAPGEVPPPNGLTFEKDFNSTPTVPPQQWKDVDLSLRLNTPHENWNTKKHIAGLWPAGQEKGISLTCPLTPTPDASNRPTLSVTHPDGGTVAAPFTPKINGYKATYHKIKRPWKTGYTDIRNYDEFNISITHNPTASPIPFRLDLYQPANITGLCPILCTMDGTPTGIPVQISKNWHHSELGSYLRAYALLPAQAGSTEYNLRIAYGFYGTLPSASHAQLSLVGYGGNGRWEQMAVGCWGETMCLDIEQSCVENIITDVRLLTTRHGANGRKWGWTNAGWGGDWINYSNHHNERLLHKELKTAYLAHGPCMTEVAYSGYCGAQNEIDLSATVRTARTDDYARTFHHLTYQFNDTLSTQDGWLFKLGKTGHHSSPVVAYGNAAGLIAEKKAGSIRKGEALLDQLELTGTGPWWITFPGARLDDNSGKGLGCRGLIIRSYQAHINDQQITHPSVTVSAREINPSDGTPNLDILLVPPKGTTSLKKGDSVVMDIEWITFPRNQIDYYGANQTFSNHLKKYPDSWKTVFREAKGNDLRIKTAGGTVLNTYPLIIKATRPEVQVKITGGIGYVPVRFEGLSSAYGYTLYQVLGKKRIPLDQSVHGNDFWQTDYQPATDTYSRTYNLPLDGLKTSGWILKAK